MAHRDTVQTEEPQPVEEVDTRPEGQRKKGRPTPKRREAQAARRKPLVVTDRKAAKEAERRERAEERARARQGMLDGDDAYLPARDRGPVRAYVRDRVDSRFTVGQVMLPILLVTLLLTVVMIARPELAATFRLPIFVLVYGMLVAGLVDGWLLARRLRGEVARVFPRRAEEGKGLATYVILRSFQMRGARTPRPAVGRGEKPRALR
ncbi:MULTISPECIES: DUF3043 domain-containing protein [Kytococcus]|uniref:DUF3043 domain-containing protein n=1 Tax=Kytococcus schroeteri TaxID=138300 RepID=A0A2I1PAK4_9MICO|nr:MULTISPECIES: DUF3043 domain-containing protein [Kytococcus]OFS15186.1 hypothetical protein HMPREF3099_02630 [Kytococcus sp. HMSC28H12]PKZ41665.1 DUF3043 domain-containing protein [Kytococcus schroeteri]